MEIDTSALYLTYMEEMYYRKCDFIKVKKNLKTASITVKFHPDLVSYGSLPKYYHIFSNFHLRSLKLDINPISQLLMPYCFSILSKQ